MLSKISSPSKNELLRKITSTNSMKISVVEVFSKTDKPTINKEIDRLLRKGHFSVIFIDGG